METIMTLALMFVIASIIGGSACRTTYYETKGQYDENDVSKNYGI